MNLFGRDARDLNDRSQGNGVEPPVHAEQERLNAGQGERDQKLKGGAPTGFAHHFDEALHALENGLHYIESDASSGNFRNFVFGAEPGLEYQLQSLGFAQAEGFFGGEDFSFYG